jgi:hypothetical protein
MKSHRLFVDDELYLMLRQLKRRLRFRSEDEVLREAIRRMWIDEI